MGEEAGLYLTGRTKERRDADTVKAEAEAAARAQQSEADAAKTQRTVSGSDTGARWSTGTPTETGEYVLRAGLPAEEKRGSYITTIRTWNGENWVDIHHVPMRLTVYRWIRLPEEE